MISILELLPHSPSLGKNVRLIAKQCSRGHFNERQTHPFKCERPTVSHTPFVASDAISSISFFLLTFYMSTPYDSYRTPIGDAS